MLLCTAAANQSLQMTTTDSRVNFRMSSIGTGLAGPHSRAVKIPPARFVNSEYGFVIK